MARLPRLTIPGFAHHVIQRGNNRQTIFTGSDDYGFMLALIGENAARFGVAVHSYVLMSNHFHLLATPSDKEGLAALMQAVGRSYVRRFNDRQQRTGTLWEGRYRSTVVQTERYLLVCMAYIDLNPVRAQIVSEPEHYAWSSHAHYVGLRSDKLITPHALYWELGNTPFAREAAYSEMVKAGIPASQQKSLIDATLSGWALGDEGFVASLQKQTERRVMRGNPGRPPLR